MFSLLFIIILLVSMFLFSTHDSTPHFCMLLLFISSPLSVVPTPDNTSPRSPISFTDHFLTANQFLLGFLCPVTYYDDSNRIYITAFSFFLVLLRITLVLPCLHRYVFLIIIFFSYTFFVCSLSNRNTSSFPLLTHLTVKLYLHFKRIMYLDRSSHHGMRAVQLKVCLVNHNNSVLELFNFRE